MKLFISGGSHIAINKQEQREEIEKAMGSSIDVVFQEGRTETASDREMWLNILSAPMLFVALIAYTLFLKIGSRVFSSDGDLREGIAEKYKADIVKVDRPLHSIFSEARAPWGLLNLIVFIPPILLIVAGAPILVISGFLLMSFTAILLAFVAGSASGRNIAMAMEIDRVCRTNDYQAGVAVVGESHKEPIEQILEERCPDIEIVHIED